MGNLAVGNTIILNSGSGVTSSLVGITAGGLIGGLIQIVLILAAVIFFFMLVIGGVRWILSGGDKAQTEAARSQLTAALIGLVIVFAAWAIAQLVGNLFGFSIFSFSLPTITN